VKALAKRLLFCWTCNQLVVVICPVTSREKIQRKKSMHKL
jgi:hypothetical protein